MNLTTNQIKDRVCDSVRKILNLDHEIDLNSRLTHINDLGADSLDLVEILMDVEEEFEIEIEDEIAEKWVRVIDICATVDRVVGEQKVEKPDPPPSCMIKEGTTKRVPIRNG